MNFSGWRKTVSGMSIPCGYMSSASIHWQALVSAPMLPV